MADAQKKPVSLRHGRRLAVKPVLRPAQRVMRDLHVPQFKGNPRSHGLRESLLGREKPRQRFRRFDSASPHIGPFVLREVAAEESFVLRQLFHP